MIIGSAVKVIVDRPLGSSHPDFPDLQYPINYGYIEGISAPDGEEQDAYVIGVSVPVKEFFGIVVALVHRTNDVEDKWVVAPEGETYSKEYIIQSVAFQEQFFKSEILM